LIETRPISNRSWWVGLVAIAAVSLAICVVLDLLYFPPTTISADEDRFLGEAADLLTTGEFRVGGDRAWEMPGTAVFFASVLSLGYAMPLVAVRIANAILL
jgi:hypothetical protein